MNKKQKEVITGSILGDGCFSRLKAQPTWNWKFIKTQSKIDIQGIDKISYINFHKTILHKNFYCNIRTYKTKPRIIASNGTITPQTIGYVLETRTSNVFTKLGKKWYTTNPENKLIKIIPKDIQITPLSLCIWYMDDGCKEKGINRVRIATNCFTNEEVEFLVNIININFNLESKLIHNTKNEPMIEIGGYDNYKKFYNIINPQVKWDCFQHKIEPPKEVVILSGENHPQTKITDINVDKIINLYNSGKTQTEIAIDFDVKPNTISTILCGKSRQTKIITQGVKGERNPRAKLTKTQVIEIRNSDLSYSKLAIQYGVSKGLIAHIIKNRCWNI